MNKPLRVEYRGSIGRAVHPIKPFKHSPHLRQRKLPKGAATLKSYGVSAPQRVMSHTPDALPLLSAPPTRARSTELLLPSTALLPSAVVLPSKALPPITALQPSMAPLLLT